MKSRTKIILVFIILIHLTFIYLSAGQLFYGDETFFLTAAREVAGGKVTGHFSQMDGKFIENPSNMLMHPPTYIYLLSLFIVLFGYSTYSVRAVSALFSIGVIILIFLITKKILDKENSENSEELALFAALLYAISPIAIQNSILIDIDGGLLNFFILLFVYLYISKKSSLYLIPALFMIFASKLTGAVVLFWSLILLSLIRKDFKESLRVVKLFLISGMAFFIIFFSYTSFFGLDYRPLFTHNSAIGLIRVFLSQPYTNLARALWGYKVFFYFITPFLFYLFVMVSFFIIKNYSKDRDYKNDKKEIILLWIYPILTFILIFIAGSSGWNFAKYHITAVPFMIILVVYFMPRNIKNLDKIYWLLTALTLVLFIYLAIFVKDPLIPESAGRLATVSLFSVIQPVIIRFILFGVIPLLLCIPLTRRLPKRKFYLALFFLVLVSSIYIDVIQAKADYSTHNLYGDKGLEEVIKYSKEIPPEQILCYVHLCYFIDDKKTWELTTLYYNKPKLIQILNDENINYVILYQKDIDLVGDAFTDFKTDKEIGSYIILKRTTPKHK